MICPYPFYNSPPLHDHHEARSRFSGIIKYMNWIWVLLYRVEAWGFRHYLLIYEQQCVCLELIRINFLHEFIGYLHTDWLSFQFLFNHRYGDIIHTCLSGSLLFALHDTCREFILVHLGLVPSVIHKVQWNIILH